MVWGTGSRSRSNSMNSSNPQQQQAPPPQAMSYAQRYLAQQQAQQQQQQQQQPYNQPTYQQAPQHHLPPPPQPRYQAAPQHPQQPSAYGYYSPQPPSPTMMSVDIPEDPNQYPFYPPAPPPGHYGQQPGSPGFHNRSFANPAGGLTGSPTTQSYQMFHPPPQPPPQQHHQPPPQQYQQPRTFGARPLSMSMAGAEFGGGMLQRRYSASGSGPPTLPTPGIPGPTEAEAKARRYRKKTPPECCHVCSATETPEWRKGPSGPRTTCNACGLVHSKMNLPEPKNIDEVLQQLEMVGCSRFRTSKHTLPPGARERCLRTWVPPIRHGASSRYSTAPNSSRQSGTYSQVERDAAAQLAALPHTRPGRSSSMSTSSQGSGSTVTGVPGTASAGLTYQRASPGSSGSSSRATTTNNRAASPARRWGTSSNTSSSSSHRNSAPDGGLGSDGAGGLPGVSFPPTMDEGPTYRSSSPDLAVNPKRLSQMSLEDEPTGDGNVQSNSRMSIANLTNPIDLSQAQGQVGGGQRERRLSSSEMAAIRYKEELEKRRRSRGL